MGAKFVRLQQAPHCRYEMWKGYNKGGQQISRRATGNKAA